MLLRKLQALFKNSAAMLDSIQAGVFENHIGGRGGGGGGHSCGNKKKQLLFLVLLSNKHNDIFLNEK